MNIKIAVGLVLVASILIALAFFLGKDYAQGPLAGVPRNATVLDLRNKGLTALPSQVGEYTQVVELLLDDNLLTGALPAEIRKMQKLEVISAQNNRLTGIPAEIGQLKNLKRLDLSNNDISTYPNELLQLQQELELDLRGNPLSKEQVATLRQALPNANINF